MNDNCPTLQTWRVWPAHGESFTISALCIHKHSPNDWALHLADEEIVVLSQACGTVIVNEDKMHRGKC